MKANYFKLFVLNVIFLWSGTCLMGQTITGKVIDAESAQALPYANVVLLQAADSVFIGGTVTDEQGDFILEKPEHTGKCMLRIQYVGYAPLLLTDFSGNLGKISLSSKGTRLDEVVVTAEAKTFRMENGGISADIQNSRLREMGTLSDVLGQIPLVRKDIDSYTVFGKGTPVFYINNRRLRNNQELRQIVPAKTQ